MDDCMNGVGVDSAENTNTPQEPVNETITLNQVVSQNSRQTVVQGTFTIPDPETSVDQIISIDKTVSIKKTNLLPNKVVVNGLLTLEVVYVAFEQNKSVHHMHGQISFTAFVDLPGATPDMDVTVDVEVEDVKINASCDQADVVAVLDVSAKVTEIREVEVLTQVSDGVDANYDLINIDDVVGQGSSQVIVSDEFEVPEEKPGPGRVLDVKSSVEITDTRIVTDKVIVDGELTLKIIYVGAIPERSVHSMPRVINFTHFVDVPGADPDMTAVVDAVVENCAVEAEGCPYFNANCVVQLNARVTQPREVRVITQCPGSTVETVALNLETVVGDDSTQAVISETINIADPAPIPAKVINIVIDKIKVTETTIITDKVLVNGYADLRIVYAAEKPQEMVYALLQRLDFRSFVDIPGAMDGMNVTANATVEYVNAEPLGCGDIDLNAVIKIDVRVTETTCRTVCVAVVEEACPEVSAEEEEECPVGQIIDYTIKPGDTLYQLAQRYSTSVNQILAQNPGIDANNLQVGQVIRIPCGAKG